MCVVCEINNNFELLIGQLLDFFSNSQYIHTILLSFLDNVIDDNKHNLEIEAW